jgi:CBS domain-containing protein
MQVKDVMSNRVIYIRADSCVFDAVEAMVTNSISGLLVGSSQRVEGIITMKDIFRKAVAKEKNLRNALVKDYMSSPVVTIHNLSLVEDAAKTMSEKRFKRLIVVDGAGNAVGMLTAMDVVSKVPKLLHVMFDTWVKPGWR